MATVRVGIVSWNTAVLLDRCLAALPAALGDIEAEVVVVDNASSDESASVAEAHPGVTVIRSPENVGYAKATPRDRIEEDVAKRLEIPTTAEGYQNQLMGGLGYPGTKARLHQVTVPTLVITGDLDQMVPPANSDVLTEAIPDARKVVIPGAGHVVFTDQPTAVAEAMLGFLDGVATDARR